METVTLVDLAPILGIVFGSMLAFAVAIMRYQHVDSTKTRDLVHTLIKESNRENRELIERVRVDLSDGLNEVRGGLNEVRGGLEEVRGGLDEVRGGLDEVRGGLGEVRERLAFIEGYLKFWPKPPHPPDDGAAEAA